MTNAHLYWQISTLSDTLKSEVADFVDFLKTKKKKERKKSERQFGCAKGMIKIEPDFDEPLDDFKDYM